MHRLRDRLLVASLTLLLSLAGISGAAAETQRHRVVAGDTLWGLARLYGVTVDALTQLNEIANPNLIPVGLILDIPGSADRSTEPSVPASGNVYEVEAGDTLSSIALRSNVSVQALQQANGVADPDFIIVGQRLTIPAPVASIAAMPAVPPHSPEVESSIEQFSAAEGLDPGLVKALAWVESGWQQGVVSPAGALGIMQITPETAAWLERDVFGQQLNEDSSAYDNVKAGVRYLKILLNATGDMDTALAAYYQGYGTTMAGTMYKDTIGYVQAVKAVKAWWWP